MQEGKSFPHSPVETDDELKTLAEVRLMTGWHPTTVYRLVDRGQLLRVRRAGHQPYYLASQIRAIIENGAESVKATYTGRSSYAA